MTKFFYFLVISAFMLNSCSKAVNAITSSLPSSGNSLTVNGDIFKSQAMTIVVLKTIDTTFSSTNTTVLTVIGLASDTLNVNIVITFPGKTTLSNAVFTSTTASAPVDIALTITPISSPTAARTYASSSGSLSVTAFGAIGTNITGTFTGSFTPASGASTGITVSSGAFSVKRTD